MSHHSSAVLQGRHSGLLAAEVVVGAHVLSGGRGCPLLCVLPAHSQRATDRLRHEIWILIPFPDQEVDPLSATRCQVTHCSTRGEAAFGLALLSSPPSGLVNTGEGQQWHLHIFSPRPSLPVVPFGGVWCLLSPTLSLGA